MTDRSHGMLKSRQHHNWIRLRTLVLLRWWAIFGQVSALIIAQKMYSLTLNIGLLYLVIGVSVITNLVAVFIYPKNKRLSESETLLIVLYDMLQLGLMLYLTGGLNNPFSVLIAGPVMATAAALSSRSTIFLGIMATLIVTVLMQVHLPLRTEQGFRQPRHCALHPMGKHPGKRCTQNRSDWVGQSPVHRSRSDHPHQPV